MGGLGPTASKSVRNFCCWSPPVCGGLLRQTELIQVHFLYFNKHLLSVSPVQGTCQCYSRCKNKQHVAAANRGTYEGHRVRANVHFKKPTQCFPFVASLLGSQVAAYGPQWPSIHQWQQTEVMGVGLRPGQSLPSPEDINQQKNPSWWINTIRFFILLFTLKNKAVSVSKGNWRFYARSSFINSRNLPWGNAVEYASPLRMSLINFKGESKRRGLGQFKLCLLWAPVGSVASTTSTSKKYLAAQIQSI